MVDAVRYTGVNVQEMIEFVGGAGYDPETNRPAWVIQTLHGPTTAEVGDWVVRGPQGDFWPVKPDIFEQSYEAAAPPARAFLGEPLCNDPDCVCQR